MAANLQGARDRWDRMNPREQRLVLALGITFVLCIVYVLVAKVQSGMNDLEKSNAQARKALRSLAVYRNAKAKGAGIGTVDIPETKKAFELDSYLENIISDLELSSPTYPALKVVKMGVYEELSFEIELKGLSIESMTQLLEKVESGSKVIVVKELSVDRNFRDKEKLDLEFTVATYWKPPAKSDDEKKDDADDKGEDS